MAGNWTEFFTFQLNYGYKWRQHPSIHHPFIPPSSIRPSSTTASTASNGLQTRLLLPHRSQSSQRTLMGSALITQLSSIDWSFSWPICKVLRRLSHSCNCQQLPQWQCWRVRALLPLCLPGSVKRASQSHRFARDNESKENLSQRGKCRRPTRLWI